MSAFKPFCSPRRSAWNSLAKEKCLSVVAGHRATILQCGIQRQVAKSQTRQDVLCRQLQNAADGEFSIQRPRQCRLRQEQASFQLGVMARIATFTAVKIVYVSAVLLCFAANADAQLSKEFKGTFILTFFPKSGEHTSRYLLNLQLQPPHWHLTLLSTNFHQEAFGDSNQVVVVTFHDVAASTNVLGPSNAEIQLFSGSRPLDARIEEHIWTALLSRSFFSGKSPPWPDVGLCIDEPCTFTAIQMGSADVSPRKLTWHNQRADQYINQTRIEGEFRWMEETNLRDGIAIPLDSELAVDIISANGERRHASNSRLIIEEIQPLAGPVQETPIISGRAVTYDYRFADNKFGKPYAIYNTYGGNLPPANAPIVQNAKALSPFLGEIAQNHRITRYILLAAFVAVTVGFVTFSLLTKLNKIKKHKT